MARTHDHLPKASYAALVVGTGFGGAVAACRLAQAGVDVAVLERGRRYVPGEFPRHVNGPDGLLWEHGSGLLDVRALNDMLVVQAAGYGGGSLVYANVHMRPPADVFDEGWPRPYSRRALDPYFDLVAHMLDVAPVATSSMPPKTRVMVEAGRRLGRADQTFLPNLAITFGDPEAPPRPNRFGVAQSACTGSGECIIGCNVGAKNTLDLNYLAIAEQQGADVATGCEVTAVEPVEQGFRVRYRDPAGHAGGSQRTVEAGSVFLCLGAVNTTELLLRCRDQFGTLPRLSGRLGDGYSGNGDFLVFVSDTKTGFEAEEGPTITMASIHDRTIDGERVWFALEDGGFPRRLAQLVPLLDSERLASLAERDLEAHVKRQAAHESSRTRRLANRDDTGVMLLMGRDRADGRIELIGADQRLHVSWDTVANLPLYNAETAAGSEIAAALGGRLTLPTSWRYLGQPVSVHNLGGCRMADRPEEGVVDPDGRVFGYPGLHVLDGAILPTSIGANPSATIAAVAERCVQLAIRRMTGADTWRAPEMAKAPRLAVPEDRVIVPAGGTPPVRAPSGGLRYEETMHGEAVVSGVDEHRPRRFRFTVTSTAVDVAHFVADPAHPAILSGTVWVEGLTEATGSAVDGGTFHLFLETGDPTTRIMSYTLPFRDHDGGRWVLHGSKPVGGHRIRDLWHSLTNMQATIAPAGDAAEEAPTPPGWARIDVPDVARLVLSFRVVGGDGRLGASRGLLRFFRFFVLTVLRVYLAGRRARRGSGRP